MSTAKIIEQAKPDLAIDFVWQEEALRRLKAYDEGRLECVSMDDAFRDL